MNYSSIIVHWSIFSHVVKLIAGIRIAADEVVLLHALALLLVDGLQLLLHLQMAVKLHKPLPQRHDLGHLVHEELVKVLDILLNVTAALVDLGNELHLLLLDIDDLVDVLLVLLDEVLLLVEDLVDQHIVVGVHLVQIFAVDTLHFGGGGQAWEIVQVLDDH